MKTRHTAGLIAVVLVSVVGEIPGFAQEAVSSPASTPATQRETNQTLSVEELAKLKHNPVSGLREVVMLFTPMAVLLASARRNLLALHPRLLGQAI